MPKDLLAPTLRRSSACCRIERSIALTCGTQPPRLTDDKVSFDDDEA